MMVINIRKSWGYILLLFIILNSGSILSKISPFDKIFFALSVFLFIFLSFYLNKIIFEKKLFYYCFVLFILSVSSFIINFDFYSYLTYINFNISIFLAYYVFLLLKIDEIVSFLISFILILALSSLVGYYLSDYMGFLKYNFEFRDQLYNYYWFYGGIDGVDFRNFSIFVEPGVFQIYLVFVLILLIFFRKRIGIKYYLTLFFIFLAIFTTKSTSGYILAILFMGILFFRLSNSFYWKILSLPISFIVIYYFSLLFQVKDNLNDKLYGSQQLSFLTRMQSTEADLSIFSSNWFSGVGFGNYLTEMQMKGYYVDAATNTYTQILAIFGVFSLIVLLLPVFILIGKKSKELIYILTVILFLLFSYYNQPFVLYPFLYFSIMALFLFGYKLKEYS